MKSYSVRAYVLLQDIMDGKDDRWEGLRRQNAAIDAITRGTLFIEELVATRVGLNALRTVAPAAGLSLTKVRDVGNVFVGAGVARFGMEYGALDELLAEVADRGGLTPVTLVGAYAMETVRHVGDGNLMFSYDGIERMYKALEIALGNPTPSRELRNWSFQRWDDYFDRWLSGYRDWGEGADAEEEQLERDLWGLSHWALTQKWRGLSNPITGAMLAEAAELTFGPPEFHGDPESWRKEGGFAEELMDKQERAVKEGRALVALRTPEPTSFGFAFLPMMPNDGGGEHVAVKFARPWTAFGQTDSNGEKILEAELRFNESLPFLCSLLFFEGLRVMIRNRCGIRCPLRVVFPTYDRCCGRVSDLVRVYAAGKWAKDKLGVEFKEWELPLECLEAALPSI